MLLDPAFRVLASAVQETLGLHLDAYRSSQLERRLHFFRERWGIRDNAELALRVRTDPTIRRHLEDLLTINVSEFFRNFDRFAELRDRFLPELLRQRRPLRVWSAGCSIGAELYSVLILLDQLDPGGVHELLGTDVDAAALARARLGVYDPLEVRAVPAQWLQRYFHRREDGWEVRPTLRQRARWARHDLTIDPYPAGWDLILCRNVVIYFSEETKQRVWEQLAASLRPGGILFVGGSESLYGLGPDSLRYVSPCFYRRSADPSP